MRTRQRECHTQLVLWCGVLGLLVSIAMQQASCQVLTSPTGQETTAGVPVNDVSCRVSVDVVKAGLLWPKGTWTLQITCLADGRTRVTVLGQKVDRPVARPVPLDDSTYLLSHRGVFIRDGAFRLTSIPWGEAAAGVVTESRMPSEVPSFGGYADDLWTVVNATGGGGMSIGERSLGGRRCIGSEVRYPRPLKWFEPHSISVCRQWVDADRGCMVLRELMGDNGVVVAQTSFGDVTKVAPNRWLPMEAVTKVGEGIGTTTVRYSGGDGAVRYPVPGFVVQTRFAWDAQNMICLPQWRSYSLRDGQEAARVVFSDYRINQGLRSLDMR